MLNLLLGAASAWVVCGLLMFLYFVLMLKRLEANIEDYPELLPDMIHIYTILDGLGVSGFLTACIVMWPLALTTMVKAFLRR